MAQNDRKKDAALILADESNLSFLEKNKQFLLNLMKIGHYKFLTIFMKHPTIK